MSYIDFSQANVESQHDICVFNVQANVATQHNILFTRSERYIQTLRYEDECNEYPSGYQKPQLGPVSLITCISYGLANIGFESSNVLSALRSRGKTLLRHTVAVSFWVKSCRGVSYLSECNNNRYVATCLPKDLFRCGKCHDMT